MSRTIFTERTGKWSNSVTFVSEMVIKMGFVFVVAVADRTEESAVFQYFTI